MILKNDKKVLDFYKNGKRVLKQYKNGNLVYQYSAGEEFPGYSLVFHAPLVSDTVDVVNNLVGTTELVTPTYDENGAFFNSFAEDNNKALISWTLPSTIRTAINLKKQFIITCEVIPLDISRYNQPTVFVQFLGKSLGYGNSMKGFMNWVVQTGAHAAVSGTVTDNVSSYVIGKWDYINKELNMIVESDLGNSFTKTNTLGDMIDLTDTSICGDALNFGIVQWRAQIQFIGHIKNLRIFVKD